MRLIIALVLVTVLVPADVRAQTLAAAPASAASSSRHLATRATARPVIDGADHDAVWATAERRSDFRTFSPREDETPAFRTEMRVAYDDRALYVFVRAFDPAPDSIARLMSRRDSDGPPNDQVQLFVDSYNDRRSGYEYIVNAAGVKSDYLMFEDSGFDQSWDGVWDVATRVDAAGWTAEFSIPLQQLRFRDRKSPTFGIMLWRLVGRTGERSSWPLYRPSRSGYMSQTGTLAGISDLTRGTNVQAVPYALTRGRNASPASLSRSHEASVAAGGDLRLQPTPNLSVDATFNPDFGQVESDPAVLDLSGFEVFQAERRSFFLQGAGQLHLPLATDGSALFFHSRRIGRAPALASALDVTDAPTETTILGAAMVTARPARAWSVAALSSFTADERARTTGGMRLVEPSARYGVGRIQGEFRGGRSGAGLMLTRMDRARGDGFASGVLPGVAQAIALTTQHQTSDGNYRASGWLAASDVRGTASAIAHLQLSNVHGFQRPEDGVAFDGTRTSLRGTAGQLFAGKVAGGITRFDLSYRFISPRFDVNEMGFLTTSGIRNVAAHAGLRATKPGSLLGVAYRGASATLGLAADWSSAGLPLTRGVTLSGTIQLRNLTQLSADITQELPGALCEMSCTRGGAALVDEPRSSLDVAISGDPRRPVIPQFSASAYRDDGGRSRGGSASVGLTMRPRSNVDISLAAEASGARHDAFFHGRVGDALSDTARITVARLAQPVRALTGRINHTVSPALSVQWYGQGYLSRGTFDRIREIIAPRAARYDDRFAPFGDIPVGPPAVDLLQFRSNTVIRWEYRPGSTLFVVWTQGRDVGGEAGGPVRVGPDAGDLFATRPLNVVAMKLSYWVSR